MPDTDTMDPQTDEAETGEAQGGQQSTETGGGNDGSQDNSGGQNSPGGSADEKKKSQSSRLSLGQARKAGKAIKGARGASAAGEGLAAVGTATGEAAVVSTSWIWIVVGIVIFIIILIIVVFSGGAGAEEERQNATGPKLTISKTGPTEAKIDNPTLIYQINFSYPGKAQDILITETIPEGTEYTSSSWPAHCSPDPCSTASKTVSWNAKENIPLTGGYLINPSSSFSVTLKAVRDNDFIINQASGTVIGAVIDTPPVGGNAPTDNDCGEYAGIINKNRFLKKNFGDPKCDLTKDDYKQLIQDEITKQDSANAAWWFLVISCESGYNPNAWLDPDTDVNGSRSPDAGGAWGLFQDGSSASFPDRLYSSKRKESVRLEEAIELPGRPRPAVGHSGDPNDRGDLDWLIQIENAIKLLPERGKGYWACA